MGFQTRRTAGVFLEVVPEAEEVRDGDEREEPGERLGTYRNSLSTRCEEVEKKKRQSQRGRWVMALQVLETPQGAEAEAETNKRQDKCMHGNRQAGRQAGRGKGRKGREGWGRGEEADGVEMHLTSQTNTIFRSQKGKQAAMEGDRDRHRVTAREKGD
eukprot:756355-Hanusia_phi.AAC.2